MIHSFTIPTLAQKKILERKKTKTASGAAERMLRIYRLMNSGVSQQLATEVIDRGYQKNS